MTEIKLDDDNQRVYTVECFHCEYDGYNDTMMPAKYNDIDPTYGTEICGQCNGTNELELTESEIDALVETIATTEQEYHDKKIELLN